MTKNPNLSYEKIFLKALSIFLRIILLLLIYKWITQAIKSKMVKRWVYALINFCNSHFVGIDEINKANGACAARKDPNDL